jgi:hypothetical protein
VDVEDGGGWGDGGGVEGGGWRVEGGGWMGGGGCGGGMGGGGGMVDGIYAPRVFNLSRMSLMRDCCDPTVASRLETWFSSSVMRALSACC